MSGSHPRIGIESHAMGYQEILKFWFEEIEEKMWWQKSPEFDEQIQLRFGTLHNQASRCELWSWRVNALGRLAEIIVLDQFSRNIYRDKVQAFANDSLALALSQEAIQLKLDQELDKKKKLFLYLPFMHSESLTIHERAVKIFSQEGLEGNLDFELKHKVIIDRFGRYPHRNKTMGRESTKEEIEFLKQPNSSF